jgi:predicted acylesterase/phospholipase RssA
MNVGADDIALVLPGGGGWIYAQAEALRVILAENSIASKIKGIYGNSAGAISSACVAAGLYRGVGTDILTNALASVTQDSQIYTPDAMPIVQHPALHLLELSEISEGVLFGKSGLNQQPLWDLLKANLGDLTAADVMQKLGIEVLVRGYDSVAGMGKVFNGQLWRMAAASSAIEVAFKPMLGISDGGPVDNAPSDLALNRGFKKILIVYCGAENPIPDFAPVTLDDSTPEPQGVNAREIAFSLFNNMTNRNESIEEERLKLFVSGGGQLVEAYPAQGSDLGSILDFSSAAQVPRVAAGHAAGLLALEQAKSLGWI